MYINSRDERLGWDCAKKFFSHKGVSEEDYQRRVLRASVPMRDGVHQVNYGELVLSRVAVREGLDYITRFRYYNLNHGSRLIIFEADGWRRKD